MKYNVYVADFETNNSKDNKESNVYLAGISHLYEDKTSLFTSISNFMTYCYNLENPLIYFHNGGKFDTFFILNYLIKNGFKNTKDKKYKKRFTFFASKGTIYNLNIYIYKKKIIIRDSYRLITYSVKVLGGKENLINYNLYREYFSIDDIPQLEKDYIISDIYYVKKALKSSLFYGSLCETKEILPSTIASYGFKLQKENIDIIKFETKGILNEKQWNFYFNFLEGGLVRANPDYLLKLYPPSEYALFDVNSEYPFICTLSLPYGKPMIKPPKNQSYITFYQIYVNSIKIKPNKTPYIREVQSNGVKKFINETTIPQWLYFIDEEWNLVQELYDIDYNIENINKTYFKSKPYFKEMILDLYAQRINFKKNPNTIEELMIKLLMNSGFFGKHCQNKCTEENYLKSITQQDYKNLPKNSRKISYNNEYYHFTTQTTTEKNSLSYVVLGAYITAKARLHIFKFWDKLNYCFVYGDTDSIIIDKTKIIEEDKIWLQSYISQTELGKIKLEQEETEIAIRAPKNYKFGNKIKSAGFTIDNKKLGLSTLDYAKSTTLKGTKTYIKNIELTKSIEKIDGLLQGTFWIHPYWEQNETK